MVTIIIILMLIIAFLLFKFYEHFNERDLFNKVAWCTTENSFICRCNLHLIEWLCNVPFYSTKECRPDRFFPNADKLFFIHENYCIRGDKEYNIAKEILEQYQRDLIQKYLSGKLREDSSIRKLTEAEYFLYTLAFFLQKHECEKIFNGNEMYKTKDYKSYGSWGGPLYDATYELTNFAVVYHKMYYIAQMYCLTLRKNPLDTDTISFIGTEETKKVIDTREMKVSRY